MNGMYFTARTAEGDYRPIGEAGLRAGVSAGSGIGAADDPRVLRFRVVNEGGAPWAGVLRLNLPFESAEPRFFLPGFIYGTNRGDAPLVADSKTPRLRPAPTEFPASPWWLCRSDRLSHPAALAFTGSRVTGLCAAPYFVKEGGALHWGRFLCICPRCNPFIPGRRRGTGRTTISGSTAPEPSTMEKAFGGGSRSSCSLFP